jgi:hypothetical protein
MEFKKIKREIFGVVISFLLWYIVFNTQFLGSFWIRITVASIILTLYARFFSTNVISRKKWRIDLKIIFTGILSGLVLYIFFLIGFNYLINFVHEGANNVYILKNDQYFQIATVLLLITSYCEEYFWRGYIQNILSINYNSKLSIIITTLSYSFIHISTLNIALIFAAFIAGLFWSIIYLKTNSLWTVIISHIIWTELIFIYLPLA